MKFYNSLTQQLFTIIFLIYLSPPINVHFSYACGLEGDELLKILRLKPNTRMYDKIN